MLQSKYPVSDTTFESRIYPSDPEFRFFSHVDCYPFCLRWCYDSEDYGRQRAAAAWWIQATLWASYYWRWEKVKRKASGKIDPTGSRAWKSSSPKAVTFCNECNLAICFILLYASAAPPLLCRTLMVRRSYKFLWTHTDVKRWKIVITFIWHEYSFLH
jgi:hypothetical protein